MFWQVEISFSCSWIVKGWKGTDITLRYHQRRIISSSLRKDPAWYLTRDNDTPNYLGPLGQINTYCICSQDLDISHPPETADLLLYLFLDGSLARQVNPKILQLYSSQQSKTPSVPRYVGTGTAPAPLRDNAITSYLTEQTEKTLKVGAIAKTTDTKVKTVPTELRFCDFVSHILGMHYTQAVFFAPQLQTNKRYRWA